MAMAEGFLGTWMESCHAPLLLRQHFSYPSGGLIDLCDKWLVGVWMDQERCAGEGFFEALESLGHGRCPGQGLGLVFEEVCWWTDDVIMDETTLQVSKI